MMMCIGTGCAGLSRKLAPPSVAAPWSKLAGFRWDPKARSVELPNDIRQLDGQRVEVRGYLVPLETNGDRVVSFVLVRDQMMCCFGKVPAPNEWILVSLSPSFPVQISLAPDRPICVTGVLQARVEEEKGVILSIYWMQAEKVLEVQGTSPGWKAP